MFFGFAVAALLTVFWLLDYLDVLPRTWARRLSSFCGLVIVVAMMVFPEAASTAIDRYAQEKAREFTKQIMAVLGHSGPGDETPTEQPSSSTEP